MTKSMIQTLIALGENPALRRAASRNETAGYGVSARDLAQARRAATTAGAGEPPKLVFFPSAVIA